MRRAERFRGLLKTRGIPAGLRAATRAAQKPTFTAGALIDLSTLAAASPSPLAAPEIAHVRPPLGRACVPLPPHYV